MDYIREELGDHLTFWSADGETKFEGFIEYEQFSAETEPRPVTPFNRELLAYLRLNYPNINALDLYEVTGAIQYKQVALSDGYYSRNLHVWYIEQNEVDAILTRK